MSAPQPAPEGGRTRQRGVRGGRAAARRRLINGDAGSSASHPDALIIDTCPSVNK